MVWDKSEIIKLHKEKADWEETCFTPTVEKSGERKSQFSTTSLENIKNVYTPMDIKALNYQEDLNFPGRYPFTRGIRPTGYRGRLWTHRLVSGAMGGKESNKIFKDLIAHGETGLNPVFDPPTLNMAHRVLVGKLLQFPMPA